MKKIFSSITLAAKTDFVKVSAWSGISTGVKMLAGLVSVKVVSNIVGPAGIAIVGQFLNGISMASMLATGGIGQGVTTQIAQYHDEPEKQKSTIYHALSITLFFTAIMSILVVSFSQPLALYIFKTSNFQSLIILFGLSIALYSVNSLLVSILNGYKSFKKFILVNIVSSIFGLAVTLFLVLRFGLYGALLNCIASQTVIILATIFFIYKEPWFSSVFKRTSFDWSEIRKLGGFSLMALITAVVTPLSQLLIRSFIATHLSIHQAGLWEGVNRLSGMYLLLITTSIGIYYLPRLAEIKEPTKLRLEIVKTSKIVLPVLVVGFFAIYVMRDVVIWSVFSSDFKPMRKLFLYQLLGDFFRVASSLIAFLFWAKGMPRPYIICELVFNTILILLVRAGVASFGLEGSVMAYAVSYFLYLLAMLSIFRKLLFLRTSKLS